MNVYQNIIGESQQQIHQGAADMLAYLLACGIVCHNKTGDKLQTEEIYINYLRSKGAPASVDEQVFYTQAVLHHLGPQLYESAQQSTL
jgi:hypothetical protein